MLSNLLVVSTATALVTVVSQVLGPFERTVLVHSAHKPQIQYFASGSKVVKLRLPCR